MIHLASLLSLLLEVEKRNVLRIEMLDLLTST